MSTFKRNKDAGKNKFVYKTRDKAQLEKQATRKGNVYDGAFQSKFKVVGTKPGKSYRFRIMPPTWESAEHFAYDVFVHKQIGADNARFVCLQKHGGNPCPPCEEEAELKREGQKDEAYQIKAKANSAMWVVDRDHEDLGPQIWAPSWMVNRDICAVSIDPETNEALWIDDPENGYDISFKVEQDGVYPKVIGLQVSRRSTPLSNDPAQAEKWLAYITEHPIPDTLDIKEYEYIAKVLSGKVVKDDAGEESGPATRSKPADEDSGRRSLRDETEDAGESRAGADVSFTFNGKELEGTILSIITLDGDEIATIDVGGKKYKKAVEKLTFADTELEEEIEEEEATIGVKSEVTFTFKGEELEGIVESITDGVALVKSGMKKYKKAVDQLQLVEVEIPY